jgi:hypothetical protein
LYKFFDFEGPHGLHHNIVIDKDNLDGTYLSDESISRTKIMESTENLAVFTNSDGIRDALRNLVTLDHSDKETRILRVLKLKLITIVAHNSNITL